MTKNKSSAVHNRHTVILQPDRAHGGHEREKHHVHEFKPASPTGMKHDHRPFKGVRKEALKGLRQNATE